MPLINPNGSFILVNGAAADWLPKSGFTGLLAHTVRGLSKLIREESKSSEIRVYELLISVRVADGPPNPGLKSAEFGNVFTALAAGSELPPKGAEIRVESEEDVQKWKSKISLCNGFC